MKLRKRVLSSLVVGAAVTAIGIGLAALGGWGPCGPSSRLAVIGGVLCMDLVAWLELHTMWLPMRLLPDLVILLIWPSLVWSVVAFAALCSGGGFGGISLVKRSPSHHRVADFIAFPPMSSSRDQWIARCTAFRYSVPSLAVGVKYPPSPFSFQA